MLRGQYNPSTNTVSIGSLKMKSRSGTNINQCGAEELSRKIRLAYEGIWANIEQKAKNQRLEIMSRAENCLISLKTSKGQVRDKVCNAWPPLQLHRKDLDLLGVRFPDYPKDFASIDALPLTKVKFRELPIAYIDPMNKCKLSETKPMSMLALSASSPSVELQKSEGALRASVTGKKTGFSSRAVADRYFKMEERRSQEMQVYRMSSERDGSDSETTSKLLDENYQPEKRYNRGAEIYIVVEGSQVAQIHPSCVGYSEAEEVDIPEMVEDEDEEAFDEEFEDRVP